MKLLDLITEIHRYCSMNGIKTTKTTVSELTNHMIMQMSEEKNQEIADITFDLLAIKSLSKIT